MPDLASLAEVRNTIHATPETLTGLRDRALLATLYATGIRPGEAVALLTTDILLPAEPRKPVLLRVQGLKNRRERRIPLNPQAERLVSLYLQAREVCTPVLFPSTRPAGRPLSTRAVGYIFERAARRAGISRPISPKIARSTFASHLLDAGVPAHIISELLGHVSPASIKPYIAISAQALAVAALEKNPLERALLGVREVLSRPRPFPYATRTQVQPL